MKTINNCHEIKEIKFIGDVVEAAIDGVTKRFNLKEASSLVMISQLSNKNCIFKNLINESMFIIDSPGPVAGKRMF
jgi:hypothetical protein